MRTHLDGESEPIVVGPILTRLVRLCGYAKKHWCLTIFIVLATFSSVLFGTEYATSRPGFCGSCHNMKPYYESWSTDVHSDENVICTDCHYAPGEQHTVRAKLKGLSQLASYVAGAFGRSRLRAHVDSESCLLCHPMAELEKKEIVFPKPEGHAKDSGQPIPSVHSLKPFNHNTHLTFLETGHHLQCATCHERRPGPSHMAVHLESCFQCHFTGRAFESRAGQCLTCHDLPEKPIQAVGSSPITHQLLQERKVNCSSCHLHQVQGRGEVHLERCLTCHDQSEPLAEWEHTKPHSHAPHEDAVECARCVKARQFRSMLHQTHVNTQRAKCVDCHLTITHGTVQDELLVGHRNCRSCHLEAHETTVGLLRGKSGMATDAETISPHAMQPSHTSCLGCHVRKTLSKGNRPVLRAGQEACKQCHGKQHEVFAAWKKAVVGAQEDAAKLRTEAHALFDAKKAALPADIVDRLETKLKQADATFAYVVKAGAMHNQKTAGTLLDDVMDAYEDVMDELDK